jgi:hypothetical protein
MPPALYRKEAGDDRSAFEPAAIVVVGDRSHQAISNQFR